MPNGRLEKETVIFHKIEKQLHELPNIFEEYYYSLRSEKKSYRTIQEYLKAVRLFMHYITNGTNNDSFYVGLKTRDINRYLITLETKIVHGEMKSTSSGYRANNWYALNSFFDFLKDNKYIDTNPVSKKTRPKNTDNPSVTYLTEKEINDMIESIKEKAPKSMVNRDLCIFILGVTTGLRVAAITQINIEDVDFDNRVIRVIEKRNKSFNIILGETICVLLKNWMEDRKKYFFDADTNALFVSQYKKRISYDAVRKLMIKYADGVTTKNVTPHVMRHTCATNLYEKTGDIYLCSAQLHHSNVTTTQRYAEISDKSMQKAANILDDIIKK